MAQSKPQIQPIKMKEERHLLIIDSICDGWQPAVFEDDEPVISANENACFEDCFEACYDDISKIYYEMKDLFVNQADAITKKEYLSNVPEANIHEYAVCHIDEFEPGKKTIYFPSDEQI